MKAKWDHRLPQLLMNILAGFLNPVTKDVTSIEDYLRTNCVSDVSFVTQMAGELEINL